MRRALTGALVALALLAAGCSKEEPSYPTPFEEVRIMTFLGQTDEGMTLEDWRGAERVLLKASQLFSEAPESGRRILVRYSCPVADTVLRPIPVEVLGVGSVQSDAVRPFLPGIIAAMQPARLEVVSSWQTGPYLNFTVGAEYSGEERGFTLVADASTLASDQVQLYFVGIGPQPGENWISRRMYGSFDLRLIDPDGTKKFAVHTSPLAGE